MRKYQHLYRDYRTRRQRKWLPKLVKGKCPGTTGKSKGGNSPGSGCRSSSKRNKKVNAKRGVVMYPMPVGYREAQ